MSAIATNLLGRRVTLGKSNYALAGRVWPVGAKAEIVSVEVRDKSVTTYMLLLYDGTLTEGVAVEFQVEMATANPKQILNDAGGRP